MKPIKDCRWEVEIIVGNYHALFSSVRWQARIIGAGVKTLIYSNKDDYKTTSTAKRNWEKFAKINKLKNWKYVFIT